MKKYFFIAAAFVAMAACTKTEVQFNETAASNKIGFEVAIESTSFPYSLPSS